MTSGRKQSTSKDASVPQGALYKNLKFPHKILLKNIKLKPNLCLQLGKLFEWFSRYFLTRKKIETKMNLSGMHNRKYQSHKKHTLIVSSGVASPSCVLSLFSFIFRIIFPFACCPVGRKSVPEEPNQSVSDP